MPDEGPDDPLLILTITVDQESGELAFDGGEMSESDVFLTVWQAWELLKERNRLVTHEDE